MDNTIHNKMPAHSYAIATPDGSRSSQPLLVFFTNKATFTFLGIYWYPSSTKHCSPFPSEVGINAYVGVLPSLVFFVLMPLLVFFTNEDGDRYEKVKAAVYV